MNKTLSVPSADLWNRVWSCFILKGTEGHHQRTFPQEYCFCTVHCATWHKSYSARLYNLYEHVIIIRMEEQSYSRTARLNQFVLFLPNVFKYGCITCLAFSLKIQIEMKAMKGTLICRKIILKQSALTMYDMYCCVRLRKAFFPSLPPVVLLQAIRETCGQKTF